MILVTKEYGLVECIGGKPFGILVAYAVDASYRIDCVVMFSYTRRFTLSLVLKGRNRILLTGKQEKRDEYEGTKKKKLEQSPLIFRCDSCFAAAASARVYRN